MLTLKHYVDDFEISLKRFLMAGLPYTVSFSSIGALLKKSVTNVTRHACTEKKKGGKTDHLCTTTGCPERYRGGTKKFFFWRPLGSAPVRTAKIFAIAQEFNR